MHEAKTHLSRLVDLALAGEEVVIARRREPVVRLSLLEGKPKKRTIGAEPSLVIRMEDGFDDPVEDWDESPIPFSEGEDADRPEKRVPEK